MSLCSLVKDNTNAGYHPLTNGEVSMPNNPGHSNKLHGTLLVPIPAACSELGGVSRPTIYALVKKGELVKVNIGSRGFITGESLAAFVGRLSEAASA